MSSCDIEMEDIFLNTISGVSNMRYFKSQQIAHDYTDQERAVNCALCH